MKNKTLILVLMVFLYFLFQELSVVYLIFLWMTILMGILTNKKNHFISLLLVLEMLSLSSIMMMTVMLESSNSLSLMFILMTLSVGEAVLGLAILVKLIRWSSSEFIMSGLN